MKEVEVKAKIKDITDFKKELTKKGFIFSETIIQKDKIYLPNGLDYSNIPHDVACLRIRDSNGKYILTLKKRQEGELIKIEKEIIINDPVQADEILKHMGYYEAIKMTKKRQKCKHKDLTICLDEVEELGAFIEIEKLTSDKNVVEIQNELFKFLEELGIQKNDIAHKGYDILLYEKNMK